MTHKTGFRNLTEAYKTLKEGDAYGNIVVDYFRYDWNSNIRQELDKEESQFNVKLFYDSDNKTSVGYKVSVVGKPKAITKYLNHFDLDEANEEELAEYRAILSRSLRKSTDDGHQFGRNRYTSYS